MPLKVMLVEDHAAFRQALASVLKSEQELEVVAQAGSLAEARKALEGGGRLDVALIDLVLPDGDGTELIEELRRSDPSIKVMILSADLWPWRIDELSRAGVDAVLDKVQSPRQIAREVRREGGAAKSRPLPSITRRGPPAPLPPKTPDEALVFGVVFSQDLERYVSAQHAVVGEEDLGHPP